MPVINKLKLWTALILIFTDQLSKVLVLKYLPNTVTINKAGAFSIEWFKVDFVIASSIALVIFILIATKIHEKIKYSIGFYLVVAGGLSNIIDRIIYGGVIDFFRSRYFATFNLADSFITIGAILIVIQLLYSPRED